MNKNSGSHGVVYGAVLSCMVLGVLLQIPLGAQNRVEIDDFTLTDTRDNKKVSLKSFETHKAVVVIFTSSHCSFALKYPDRLNALYDEYSNKQIGFLAINSNDSTLNDSDATARMRAQSPYKFPYLKDNNQTVANKFRATRTPEVVVLQPTKEGKFISIYRGKIDDNPLDANMVEKYFLKLALEAALSGKPMEPIETEPSGCNIRWKL